MHHWRFRFSNAWSAAGGRHWPTTSSRDLRPGFARALDEMRARYVLSFYPQGVPRAGWHDVRMTLKRGRGDLIARSGYFVEAVSKMRV